MPMYALILDDQYDLHIEVLCVGESESITEFVHDLLKQTKYERRILEHVGSFKGGSDIFGDSWTVTPDYDQLSRTVYVDVDTEVDLSENGFDETRRRSVESYFEYATDTEISFEPNEASGTSQVFKVALVKDVLN